MLYRCASKSLGKKKQCLDWREHPKFEKLEENQIIRINGKVLRKDGFYLDVGQSPRKKIV